MRLTDDERAKRKQCACGTLLRRDNPDGVCRDCRKAGKKAEAAANGPRNGRDHKATPPRKTNAKPARANGIATICVTETNLNAFWMKLSLEEKANLFQRQLEGV